MKRISSPRVMQKTCLALRAKGEKTGFVPTMGFLHEGHLSLVERSIKECTVTAVSIFVNPAQFAPHEDLKQYPRDMSRDMRLLRERNVDIVFTPAADLMYPEPFLTYVSVGEMSKIGEGKSRPSHFRGVTTIVTKLLNIVRPDFLYLGQKDIQQALILKKMTQDLNVDVVVSISPTVREPDGLAISSRNVYLKNDERKSAVALYAALRAGKEVVRSGMIECKAVKRKMKRVFGDFPVAELEYILCVDGAFRPVEFVSQKTIIAVAARVGSTRLIDNIIVTPPRKSL